MQRLKAARLKNIPGDLSCVLRVSFVSGEDRDGFHESHPIPAMRLLWKKPNLLNVVFIEKDPRGTSYFEARMQPFLRRLKGMRSRNNLTVSPFDIFFAILEGDMNAKGVGVEKIEGRPAMLVYFPSVFAPLPMGAVGNGVKIWIDKDEWLPVQGRLFTQQGIFTFTLTYAAQRDKAGKAYQLPVKVVLYPDLSEERRSAAFPVTVTISDYKINSGLTDVDFK
ncbi:MAG: hypothetical protein GXP25_18750 [Planctomycetes bacterium]|nr:hypothetical protein [Planctomycetota bacterium]